MMKFFLCTLLLLAGSLAADPGAGKLDGGDARPVFRISGQKDFDLYKNHHFPPGAMILFARGAVFNGQFAPSGSGTRDLPILVSAYDPETGTAYEGAIEDKPIIQGHGKVEAPFMLRNAEYWTISNLEVTNSDGTDDDQGDLKGIYVLAEEALPIGSPDDFPGPDVRGITIRDCVVHNVNGNVSDVHRGGIHVHADGYIRFVDLLIENNLVSKVGGIGIGTQQLSEIYRSIGSRRFLPWLNVRIRNNRVDSTGRNNIIFRTSVGAVVEYNTLANSSRFDTGNSVYNFNTVDAVMQYNEAYGNTGSVRDIDRGGYDADWNARGTVIQYNYSHGNHWFASIMRRGPNDDITVRYNISVNDLLGVYHYGFTTDDCVRGVLVYNNTHYLGEGYATTVFPRPPYRARTPIHTLFANNVFYFADPARWGHQPDEETTTFENNLFFNLRPRGSDHVLADPMFYGPVPRSLNLPPGDPRRLDVLRLRGGSPAIGAGREIEDNGGVDFWGNRLYNGSPDIGAHEWHPPQGDPPPARTAPPCILSQIAAEQGADGPERDQVVAEVEGKPVFAGELDFAMRRLRGQVAAMLYREHGIRDADAIWRTEVEGRPAREILRQRAMEQVLEQKAEQIMALRMGLIDTVNFHHIMKAREVVNRMRREKVERGEPVFGQLEFCRWSYFDYFMDMVRSSVKHHLGESDLALPEEELRRRYRQLPSSGNHDFAALRGALQRLHVEQAYESYLSAVIQGMKLSEASPASFAGMARPSR